MEMEKTTIYIGEVIKNVMVEKLVTKAELARRLQVKPQSVDYMLTRKSIDTDTLYSRPLKSAHLRNIVRKQYPADFFNKPQKSPHGSFEVVCGGS